LSASKAKRGDVGSEYENKSHMIVFSETRGGDKLKQKSFL